MTDLSVNLCAVGMGLPLGCLTFSGTQQSLREVYEAHLKPIEDAFGEHVRDFTQRLVQPAVALVTKFRQAKTDYNVKRMRADGSKEPLDTDKQASLEAARSKFELVRAELTNTLTTVEVQKEDALAAFMRTLLLAQSEYYRQAHQFLETLRPSFEAMDMGARHTRFLSMRTDDLQGQFQETTIPIGAPAEATVWIGTWNVGNAQVPETLEPWIPMGGGHDIYAVGVQECEYKHASMTAEQHFFACVRQTLGQNYYVVGHLNIMNITARRSSKNTSSADGTTVQLPNVAGLGGIRLLVLACRVHKKYIHKVQKSSQPTGNPPFPFNKGGVGISFDFYDLRLCFLNCHLAAHADAQYMARRHQDAQDIINGIKLGNSSVDMTSQFHHVFWFGDLNYRIDLERPQVAELSQAGKIDDILAHDQLNREKAAGRVLPEFREGPITFQPTFKFNRDSLDFDTEKFRVPSYTDRILWSSFADKSIEQRSYESHREIRTSDHHPVSASFAIEVSRFEQRSKNVEAKACEFVISDVDISCRSMGAGNSVLLVFHTPYASSIPYEHKTNSPDVHPPIRLRVSALEHDRSPHLMVAILSPPGSLQSSPSRIGEGVVYMRDLPKDSETPMPLACPLYHNGLPSGEVNLHIAIASRRPEHRQETTSSSGRSAGSDL